MNTYCFKMSLNDFDVSLLPANKREVRTAEFQDAVSEHLKDVFKGLGGESTILVSESEIEVEWKSDVEIPDVLEEVIKKLEEGSYKESILFLELLLSVIPDDKTVLYNLGMALSDAGELKRAEKHLHHLIQIAPNFANGLIALGVALARQEKDSEALELFERASKIEPNNPWAHRNIGWYFLKIGNYEKSTSHLLRATQLKPDDQRSWYGLAQAYELSDRLEESDKIYRKVIDLDQYSSISEDARKRLSEIAYKAFRNKTAGISRPDAVMYCLAAIEKFAKMPKEDVQKIAFEIAMLGNKGLDVNNPESQYKLNSMSGIFTGLQLVSYMYVGFQIIEQELDIGFDLKQEYKMAKDMYGEHYK